MWRSSALSLLLLMLLLPLLSERRTTHIMLVHVPTIASLTVNARTAVVAVRWVAWSFEGWCITTGLTRAHTFEVEGLRLRSVHANGWMLRAAVKRSCRWLLKSQGSVGGRLELSEERSMRGLGAVQLMCAVNRSGLSRGFVSVDA